MAGVLGWLYDYENEEWRPARCDDTGRMSIHAIVEKLEDIEDVDLTGIADVYILYWDVASSTWKVMAIPAAAWADITGKPTAPSLEEMAAEHEDDGTHGDITPSSCSLEYTHPGVVQCDAITTCDKHTKVAHDALGLSHDSLADVSKDDHHNEDHAARHQVGGGDILYVPRTYVWFVPGDVAVGAEQGPTFRMKRATIIEDVELHVKTAPTGAALIVDILEAGTTVFTTKPEIDIAGTTEDDNHVFSDTALAAAAELRMDITQVGSTIAGEDLTVLLHCKEPVI